MRKAILISALLLAGCREGTVGEFKIVCGPDHPCNLRVTAPLQLDGAAITVDGEAVGWLTSIDAEHPFLEILRQFLGRPKRTFVIGAAHGPKGRHTVRIVKPGWQEIERVVEVTDPNLVTGIQICAADVRPSPRIR